jgi:pimeloyl-ACP methyl ester carboxylesterase
MLLRRWPAAGFTCLAIDAPGHGERADAGGAPRRSFFEYVRARLQNAIDLRRGIDLLQAEGGAAADRIGYWGVSMGGTVGVMLLAAEGRVGAACLCLAGARPRRSWPDADPGAVAFAASTLDPATLAAHSGDRPVLMLNGERDETVAPEDARRLFEGFGGPKELRWFNAGHHVTPAMLRASKDFFDRVLS